jgi:hypothetical protein
MGSRDRKVWDWWTAPFEGGQAVRAGAFEVFRRHRLKLDILLTPFGIGSAAWPAAWSAQGNQLLCSTGSADSVNIWALRFLQEPGKSAARQNSLHQTPTGRAVRGGAFSWRIDHDGDCGAARDLLERCSGTALLQLGGIQGNIWLAKIGDREPRLDNGLVSMNGFASLRFERMEMVVQRVDQLLCQFERVTRVDHAPPGSVYPEAMLVEIRAPVSIPGRFL